jgi:hypothetical protein
LAIVIGIRIVVALVRYRDPLAGASSYDTQSISRLVQPQSVVVSSAQAMTDWRIAKVHDRCAATLLAASDFARSADTVGAEYEALTREDRQWHGSRYPGDGAVVDAIAAWAWQFRESIPLVSEQQWAGEQAACERTEASGGHYRLPALTWLRAENGEEVVQILH